MREQKRTSMFLLLQTDQLRWLQDWLLELRETLDGELRTFGVLELTLFNYRQAMLHVLQGREPILTA